MPVNVAENFFRESAFPNNLEKLATPKFGSYLYVDDKDGIIEVNIFTKIFEGIKGLFGLTNKTSGKAIGERLFTIIKRNKGQINQRQLALLRKVANRGKALDAVRPEKETVTLSQKFTKIEINLTKSRVPTTTVESAENAQSGVAPLHSGQQKQEVETPAIIASAEPSEVSGDANKTLAVNQPADEASVDAADNIVQIADATEMGTTSLEQPEVEVSRENQELQDVENVKQGILQLPIPAEDPTKQHSTASKIGKYLLMALPVIGGVMLGAYMRNNTAPDMKENTLENWDWVNRAKYGQAYPTNAVADPMCKPVPAWAAEAPFDRNPMSMVTQSTALAADKVVDSNFNIEILSVEFPKMNIKQAETFNKTGVCEAVYTSKVERNAHIAVEIADEVLDPIVEKQSTVLTVNERTYRHPSYLSPDYYLSEAGIVPQLDILATHVNTMLEPTAFAINVLADVANSGLVVGSEYLKFSKNELEEYITKLRDTREWSQGSKENLVAEIIQPTAKLDREETTLPYESESKPSGRGSQWTPQSWIQDWINESKKWSEPLKQG